LASADSPPPPARPPPLSPRRRRSTGAFAGASSGVLEFNALHSITGKREVIGFLGSTAKPQLGTQRMNLLQLLLADLMR